MPESHDPGQYDPERHETQLVAVMPARTAALAARDALLGAGVPAEAIELVPPADDLPQDDLPEMGDLGVWATFKRLFAPREEAHSLGAAVTRGQVMVVVHPDSPAERETAIEILESFGPIDLDEQPAEGPVDHRIMNHAATSRADAERQAERPRSEAEPPPPPPSDGISYTYGIPEPMARALGAGEQELHPPSDAADHPAFVRPAFVRIVEERLRTGWRDQPARANRVRSYVAERSSAPQRVELLEEEIIQPTAEPIDRKPS